MPLSAESQKRVFVHCTYGCRIFYHYPRCWRKLQQDLKILHPTRDELLKVKQLQSLSTQILTIWGFFLQSKDLITCLTEGCPGYIRHTYMYDEGPASHKHDLYTMSRNLEEKIKELRKESTCKVLKLCYVLGGLRSY